MVEFDEEGLRIKNNVIRKNKIDTDRAKTELIRASESPQAVESKSP